VSSNRYYTNADLIHRISPLILLHHLHSFDSCPPRTASSISPPSTLRVDELEPRLFIMPGILPMKVIKVGSNSQSRIAQACDRCRSKKIRCDGATPCCTQCKNVGFECKTSDKLSRRAFPRGYTESLEERVRNLEAEVRELKDLLDEKDEKIDLLSKIHSFSPSRRPSNQSSSIGSEAAASPSSETREDMFKIQQSPFLHKSELKSDPFFVGASSARFFVGKLFAHLHAFI
jgi:hypothetical protein